MEPKKYLDKKGIIVLVLGILIIGGLSGYLINNILANKDNKPNNTEEQENNKPDEQEEEKPDTNTNVEPNNNIIENLVIDVEKICDEAKKGSVCTNKVTINGKKQDIKLFATQNEIEPNRYEYTLIEVGGYEVYNEGLGRIGQVTVLDDVLLVDVYCVNCGGSSASIPVTKIMDLTGKIVYDLGNIQLDANYNYETYSVKDNEIIVTTSRAGFFDDYLPKYDCYLKGIDTGVKGIMDANVVNGTNYDKFASTIAKIDYRIPYLGRNRFSELVKLKEYKFGELYTKAHCINEYSEYLKVKDTF